MTLAELKNQILDNKITDGLIVFVCDENYYLADQYVDAIVAKTGLEKHLVNSIAQRYNPALALVIDYSNYLYVLKTDTFDEVITEPNEVQHTIIICNKVDKKAIDTIKSYIVEVPKLLDWQVKDYMKVLCPGLDNNIIDWAYSNMGGDIYKIKNELDKIRLFPASEQQLILTDLRFADGTDLYYETLFQLSEAIIKNNRREVLEFLYHRNTCNIDPIGLVSMLLATYKKILFVTQRSGLTAQDIGITDKQYNAIKYYYKGFTSEKLESVISSLSTIDLDLKSGRLDMPKPILFDYILSKIL